MAAEPEVRKVIKFHARLGRNHSRRRHADLDARMADRRGVGFGHLARPFAVRERHRDVLVRRMQHQLGIGDTLPRAGLGLDVHVVRRKVIRHAEGIIGVDIHMAAEPEIRKVIELHAVFGRKCIGWFGRLRFGRFAALGGRFGRRSRFGRFGGAGLLDHCRFDETEPDQQCRQCKDHDDRDDAEPAALFAVLRKHTQDDQHDRRKDDRIEQRNQRVPIRRVVGLHLHGGGVRLRI